MTFEEFLKVGRKFNCTGLSETYQITNIVNNDIIIKVIDSNSGIVLLINRESAKNNYKINYWIPIIEGTSTINKSSVYCSKCGIYNEYASLDQDNNYTCWSCKNGF